MIIILEGHGGRQNADNISKFLFETLHSFCHLKLAKPEVNKGNIHKSSEIFALFRAFIEKCCNW